MYSFTRMNVLNNALFIIVAKFLSRPHLNLYGGEWIISCAVLQVDFSKPEQSPIEK